MNYNGIIIGFSKLKQRFCCHFDEIQLLINNAKEDVSINQSQNTSRFGLNSLY